MQLYRMYSYMMVKGCGVDIFFKSTKFYVTMHFSLVSSLHFSLLTIVNERVQRVVSLLTIDNKVSSLTSINKGLSLTIIMKRLALLKQSFLKTIVLKTTVLENELFYKSIVSFLMFSYRNYCFSKNEYDNIPRYN